MAQIRWTKEAITWLQDIYEYIAKDVQKVQKEKYKKGRCFYIEMTGNLYKNKI